MESIQDKLMQQFQNMDDIYEAYAKSKGLTYLSLMVLEEICELGDGCTQKQISDDTHYPKQSINLAVKAFLEDGIVELKELPKNRKNKGITLTDKGRLLCEDVIAPLLEPDSHPGELCRDNPQIVERNVLNRNLALGHRGHADKTAHLESNIS